MLQERGDLDLAHGVRVTLAVKNDELPDPVHIRLFDPDALMPHPQRPAHFFQKFGLAGGGAEAEMVLLRNWVDNFVSPPSFTDKQAEIDAIKGAMIASNSQSGDAGSRP